MTNTNEDFKDYLSKWFYPIDKRRSRRHYDRNRAIPSDIMKQLELCCEEFRPYSCARSSLVAESADRVFKGVIGSYGKIKNAPAFIAFIGDMSNSHVQEAVGYTGEGIILEATALGLSTCWVGGFFNPDVVASLIKLNPNEKVLAVTPVGYSNKLSTIEEQTMTGFGFTHRRKPYKVLTSGLPQTDWPEWIKSCLEAARQAPSAVNRQPWGFQVEPDAITLYVRTSGPEFSVAKRLDCGIAMMHIDAAVHHLQLGGSWEILEPPQVAKFRILPETH